MSRYAAAPVLVVTIHLELTEGSGEDRSTESARLPERGRLDASLPGRISAAPGVCAVVTDVAVPGGLISDSGTAAVELHPWSAARLTPFALKVGAAPAGGDQVVLDQNLAARIGARPGRRYGSGSHPRHGP